MSTEALNRESLIWKIAHQIALNEDKTNGRIIVGDRQYILRLIKEVSAVIDEGLIKAAKGGEEL
ncbi:hypothetical protein [Acetobacter orientalis]|uniref:hypothetical protein n=1 Tax=Acetobacter orientalis TaxID=146474 RepID=UPI0039E9ABAA